MPPDTGDLATLLILEEDIRKQTNIREYGFFTTNETHRLIPYHTAYLWQIKDYIGAHLVSQSGTPEIDIHAPSNQWLFHKINEIRSSQYANEIHTIDRELENKSTTQPLSPAQEWSDALPEHLLWCPLLSKKNKLTGGLLFFRETAFTEPEIKKITWLIDSYQYTWQVLVKHPKIPTWDKLKEKRTLTTASIMILVILVFPIRLSVFGEGTVVPKSPTLINAPLQGIIKDFSVSPGQVVQKDQLLLSLNKTDLLSTAEVSKRNFELTQAKLRTAINEGFKNKQSRSDIPILRAQLAIDHANYQYAYEMLKKTELKSPKEGIVIFDSKEDWVGQPVKTGERILIIADPKKVELKITLPVSNTIELQVGNKGDFYLYGQLSTLPIKLTTLGYNAKLMPNKILAYQLSADFTNPKDLPQLGAQGTVKIYGHYVPLIYYVLRRPIQVIRQTLGL